MRFVFFTIDGIGLPIAYRLQQEGNDVIVGQVSDWKKLGMGPEAKEEEKNPSIKEARLKLYDGMLEKVDADKLLKALLKVKNKDEYFIVCDFNYLWRYASPLKEAGFKGLLPHRTDFLLEKDREKAKKLVEQYYPAISKQEHHQFSKIDEAIEFIQNAELEDDVKQELIEELKVNQKAYESEGFILEKKISDPIEFVPEITIFSGKVLGVNIDIENKPVGDGNLGNQTGAAMDLVFWIKENGKIFEMFLQPIIEHIAKNRRNELIIWDLGTIYSPRENKFYFTEYCSDRPGYNAWFTELSTLPSVTEYFNRIVNEQPLFTPDVRKFGVSVRLFDLTRYNKDDKPVEKTKKAITFDESNRNIWIRDVFKENDKYFTTGYDTDVAVVTGSSDDLIVAVENAYKLLEPKITEGYVVKGFSADAPTIVPVDKRAINFGEMYHRTKEDYLSASYRTSIINRYNWLKMLFGDEIPEISITELVKENVV